MIANAICDTRLLEAVAESGNLAEGGLVFSHQKWDAG